ncbi:MAG TPA: hypothetical protein VGR35_13025 [Tepidisphaeraceae bacterium]|nr:hypothetical protein [Tepidisphaeraceae bacterium]
MPSLRVTAGLMLLLGWNVSARCADPHLPPAVGPPALEFPHFPSRMHAFVWRNWNVVETTRLAEVLGTSAPNVAAVAASMGLPPEQPVSPEMGRRGYITIIRRNWHLLTYDQLLVLLDMTAQDLAYALREDDFLYLKLGGLKPRCEPLKYVEPDVKALQRCEQIKALVGEHFGEELKETAEPPFEFLKRFEPAGGAGAPTHRGRSVTDGHPRYIYSYFAVYGDPLLDPRLDPYPDSLLQQLSDLGVNGVWLHVVLRQLAPGGEAFPEFGQDHEKRLENLAKLVARAKRHGIGVYLYMNEPRAMPNGFFRDAREAIRGVQGGDYHAMCTSTVPVRTWLIESLSHVFRRVPDLAGVFTITASENLTNCASHRGQDGCPRCKQLGGPRVIAEVNRAIAAGVHQGNPKAKVMVWDWGWPDDWTKPIIDALPKEGVDGAGPIYLQSVSEWSLPITRGGVQATVGEYSISAVGPGPRATHNWHLAKQAGLKTVAKVQVNNTWELSAVPYLPVMDLVAEHAHNLASIDVDGLMLSWSLGGYPSPNLEIARRIMDTEPTPSTNEVLGAVARERFGEAGAVHARKAWNLFSDAFREYPYHSSGLYTSPAQYGPSNLLYAAPTGYAATMVGFPYDDVDRWRGPYPPDVYAAQFEKVAAGFDAGIAELAKAIAHCPPERRDAAEAELRFAKAARLHFRTIVSQTRFVVARNELATQLPSAKTQEHVDTIRKVVEQEIVVARELFTLARQDSRIGFEASNHYYYLPQDLIEKVINCRHVLGQLAP